jgi:hypothetical protein
MVRGLSASVAILAWRTGGVAAEVCVLVKMVD